MRRASLAAAVAVGATAVVVAAALADGGPPPRGPAGWAALEPSPLERTEVGAARIGDRLYVVGGFVPEGGDTGRMVAYDISEDSWIELAPLPIAVNHAGVVRSGSRLYVLGGKRDSIDALSDRLYSYDPDTDDWKRLADAPTPRMAMALAAWGGKLYAAGGKTEASERFRGFEIYSRGSGADSWRTGPSMRVGRNHVAGTEAYGSIYAIGGRPGPIAGGKRVVERYSPRSHRWRKVAPLATARSGAAAATLDDGRIVVFGGEELGDGGETIEQVEIYDPAGGEWSSLPDMITPRHGLGGVARGSTVYALEGGPMPGLAFSNANEFLDVPD